MFIFIQKPKLQIKVFTIINSFNARKCLQHSQQQTYTLCKHIVIQMATILSKMSQLFSQINYIYLNSMMNAKSMDIGEQFKVFEQFESEVIKRQQQVKSDEGVETTPKLQKKEIKQKDIQKQREKKKQTQKQKERIKEKQKEKQKEKENLKSKTHTLNKPPNPPPSSFLLFFKDHKDKIAQQYPQNSLAELSKIASQCWKQLSAQEKKVYHDKFNDQKMKYYEAMKIYNKLKQKNEEIMQKQVNLKKRGRKPKKQNKKQSQISQSIKKSSQDSDDDDSSIKI